MLQQAAQEWDLDLSASFLVGDAVSDIETAHAVAWIVRESGRWSSSDPVLLCVSGRGDKDMVTISEHELPSL